MRINGGFLSTSVQAMFCKEYIRALLWQCCQRPLKNPYIFKIIRCPKNAVKDAKKSTIFRAIIHN